MNPGIAKAGRRLPGLALLLAFVPAWANQSTLEQAESLLEEQRVGAALELLTPLEAEHAGEAQFDYLLGRTRLANGEPGSATLALERAVAVDPAYAAARMELARAYYESGALADAQREFLLLRAQNPPPAARLTISEYLARIEGRPALPPPSRRFYFIAAAGYDDNANVATEQNDFLGFALDDTSLAASSSYLEAGGGMQYHRQGSRARAFDVVADLAHRHYPDASFVDSTTATVATAWRWAGPEHTRHLAVRGYRLQVDGGLNSQGLAVSGGADFQRSPVLRLGVFGRAGVVRYEDVLSVKDVDQVLVTGTAARVIGPAGQGTFGASVLLGRDWAVESASRYSRDILGARVESSWIFSESVRGYASLGAVRSNYDEVFFPDDFDSPRDDTLLQAAATVSWRLSPDWVLLPTLAWYDNDSDVDIFAYDRLVVDLRIQRLWN